MGGDHGGIWTAVRVDIVELRGPEPWAGCSEEPEFEMRRPVPSDVEPQLVLAERFVALVSDVRVSYP